jgi:hypothetical protein
LLGFLPDPEDGGRTSFSKVGELLPDYSVSRTTSQYPSIPFVVCICNCFIKELFSKEI